MPLSSVFQSQPRHTIVTRPSTIPPGWGEVTAAEHFQTHQARYTFSK